MKEFTHYKPRLYRIAAGGKTIERRAAVLSICNASQYGNNAFVAPQASVSDGLLDIFILEECNNLAMAIAGFEVMAGIADQNKHVEIMRVPEATIELEPGSCMHIDGEPIEHAPLSIHFSILDKRLKVLAGTLTEKVTPFVTPLELALKQATYNITKPFR